MIFFLTKMFVGIIVLSGGYLLYRELSNNPLEAKDDDEKDEKDEYDDF